MSIQSNCSDDKGELNEIKKMLQSSSQQSKRVVSRLTLRSILRLFLAGELTSGEVRDWANLVEASDAIDYEVGFEKQIADAMFCLSSPEINAPLDQVAPEILKALG